MTARRLIAFRHDSPLGNAPAHKLLDLVKAGPAPDRSADVPARAFEDYAITFDETAVPAGVVAEVLL
jgi:CRISPR-associated protein Csd2